MVEGLERTGCGREERDMVRVYERFEGMVVHRSERIMIL